MGILRGLGTAICSFLLFLALVVFSVAFLLNGTVLNPDFMNSQIDKLDTSEISQEVINEQLSQELPQNSEILFDIATQVIKNEEVLIKAQINAVIDDAYAYLLQEKDDFTLSISLVAVKQDLKDNIWQLAVDYLKSKLANMTEAEVDAYARDIADQIPKDTLSTELALLPSGLRIEIITQYIKELGGRGIFEEVSFGLDFLVEDQVRSSVEEYFDQYINQVPDSFTIDESVLGTETMATIEDVRTYIAYFKTAYIWLIVFMAVMIVLIFLINWRNIRASLRALGINLLVFGVLDLAGVLIALNLPALRENQIIADLPASMQSWAQGLVHDLISVMLPFSIIILILGAGLTVASFFVKNPEPQVPQASD